MKNDNCRKSLLYRKAQGNKIKSEYYHKIESLIQKQPVTDDFMNLQGTDEIIEHLSNKKEISIIRIETTKTGEIIKLIQAKSSGKKCFLILDDGWKFCGAYKINGTIHYNQNYNFDDLSSDEIRIIAADLSFQIRVDYDDGEITYELIEYL